MALLTVVLISASCYFEEWMYKKLPNFNYFWTVACAELAVFTVASVAGAVATGTLGAPRKAPFAKYVLQATVMAVYAAIAKIAYKYLNYATGTVLRSTKLVFVMAISVAWLGRTYSRWDYAAAVGMIVSVACFGLGEAHADKGSDHTWGYVLSLLGLGLAALQTNMADNAMRDHGATSLENMLYVNGLGFWIVLVFASVVDGKAAIDYMLHTETRAHVAHRAVPHVLPRRVRVHRADAAQRRHSGDFGGDGEESADGDAVVRRVPGRQAVQRVVPGWDPDVHRRHRAGAEEPDREETAVRRVRGVLPEPQQRALIRIKLAISNGNYVPAHRLFISGLETETVTQCALVFLGSLGGRGIFAVTSSQTCTSDTSTRTRGRPHGVDLGRRIRTTARNTRRCGSHRDTRASRSRSSR